MADGTATSRAMSATRPVVQSPSLTSPGTLGALLYRDSAKVRVAESEWAALVDAVADGNGQALRALYERTHRLVFTFAIRISNDRATAEEVTLDVFHELWRSASNYDPANGTVIGWLMNVTRSRAIDRLRREQRIKRTPPTGVANITEFAGLDEDVIERREGAARLRVALAKLTEEERAAIELAYFSDSTYAEVARKLNEPLGTVKTRIRSGLAKLRSELARERVR